MVKRYFNVVEGLLVIVIAYFQAQGLTQLLGAALLAESPPRAPVARRRLSTPAAKSGAAIAGRNPFDSSAKPPVPVASATSREVADPLAWPACPGVQALIVTESSDPWWSLASLREPGSSRARLRRLGDGVAGKRVAFIGYNPRQGAPAVWLEGGDSNCQSLLSGEPAVLVRAREVENPPAQTSGFASQIRKLRDNEYEVERSLVDSSLRDMSHVLRSVRVVPALEGGKTVGVRLFGIRTETLLGSFGLRNGDRLDSINGFEVADPEKALEAFARLRTARQLRLRLNRAGAPLDISLTIS